MAGQTYGSSGPPGRAHHSSGAGAHSGSGTMQSTGQAGRHFSQPLHSWGMITTSTPWLKMAPNWGGQARRQAAQFMHIDMSMRSGGALHLGVRRPEGNPPAPPSPAG